MGLSDSQIEEMLDDSIWRKLGLEWQKGAIGHLNDSIEYRDV